MTSSWTNEQMVMLEHDDRNERCYIYIYYNYEKYPLSPLKPRSMALIEQYLPNISDPVYSVHQSHMWFLWLKWRKCTFYPVTAPNDSKCWPIVTSSIQEPVASNCDVTMTDCSGVVAMDAFLAQWCWGQWFYFVTPVFQHGASLVYIYIYIYMSLINEIITFYPYEKNYYYVAEPKWCLFQIWGRWPFLCVRFNRIG